MSHVIREDEHSQYVKCAGQIYRPLFPLDYPPHRNTTSFATGTRVKCSPRIDTPLVIINTLADAIEGKNETWFAHGAYMQPDGDYRPSNTCFKPFEYTWPNSFSVKRVRK